MDNFRATYKFILFAISFVLYIALAALGHVLTRDPVKRRHYFARNVLIFARFGLWFMNVKLTAKNVPGPGRNYFFVGNHLGMLDVILLSSVQPALFITSVEMKEMPGIGILCDMGGCLFVERRNRSNIQNEIGEIREALRQGVNVVLYPEGTSTNGERVLPFKKSLLTSAAGTGVAIKPVVVNYTHVNGEPMSDRWRDSVCWYGDIPFLTAIWKLFQSREVRAELDFLDEIIIHSEEQRREIAALAHERIAAVYRPIVKPPTAG